MCASGLNHTCTYLILFTLSGAPKLCLAVLQWALLQAANLPAISSADQQTPVVDCHGSIITLCSRSNPQCNRATSATSGQWTVGCSLCMCVHVCVCGRACVCRP